MSSAAAARTPFPANWTARLVWIALALYVVYACGILDVSWDRFVRGLDNGAKFLGRMFPPDFSRQKLLLLREGMVESMQIAVLSTAVGVVLSLPLGLLAARNLMPAGVSWTARALPKPSPPASPGGNELFRGHHRPNCILEPAVPFHAPLRGWN